MATMQTMNWEQWVPEFNAAFLAMGGRSYLFSDARHYFLDGIGPRAAAIDLYKLTGGEAPYDAPHTIVPVKTIGL